MLYNRYSDTELERAVYIDPSNAAARDELIARVPLLLDRRSDQLQEAEMMLEVSERERKSEIANMEEELHLSERHAANLQRDLDGAQDRIAQLKHDLDSTRRRVDQLTRAEDLV